MPEPAFKRFGKYEIQAELGRGGFGTVFRAFDPTVGRLVAIKTLTSEAGKDLLTRFRTEAMAAGNLRHENIVTIYEFGEDKGVPFIVMEYLEGEDLQQALASAKPLTLLDKISIMTQAAAGLDCAHRHGVVHRDVKPANIRLLPDGRVKIMDFGIARLTRDARGARLTRQGHVLGTLLYMAPEQVMGSETDALSDIFAYGVTFYELLTGRHPFQAADPRSVFYKITSEDPELIHHLVPDCPETLDQVIRRALHKDRELRYQTLRDLRVDVEPVLIELRKERAATLVIEVQHLIEDRSFERAQSIVNEAIDLDAASPTARQLRDAVQMELRRRLVRPRIEALITKADQSIAEDNYSDALQTLEAALRLDPEDAALQARSRDAQQQWDQKRESNRLLIEARTNLAQGSLAMALEKASEAVALNPKSMDARSLLEIVQLEINKLERQHQLHERLRQARELLLVNSLTETLALMDTLEPDERDTPEARDVLARVAAQKAEKERQERLNSELTSAQDLLDRRQFIDAVRLLQRLRSEFPGESRVGGLLSNAQQKLAALEKAQAIENLRGEVLACAEEKRFEDAVGLLKSALDAYPGDTGILRLRDVVLHARSAWERRQAVEQTVRQCEALADQDQFDEALATLGDTRRIYPDDAALDGLERRLEAGRKRFLRAQAVLTALAAADQFTNEGRPESAVVELEAALAKSDDQRLRQALAQAHEAVAAKQRAALLEQIDRTVRRHIERREFEPALQALDGASVTLGGEHALPRLREAVLAGKAASDREEAIAAAVKNAQALRSEQRLEEAEAVMLAGLERFPDSAELARLSSDLREERERRAEAARAAREQALERGRQEARELAGVHEFERALAVVDAAGAEHPGQPEIENLRAEIIAGQTAWIREREIAAAAEKRRAETIAAVVEHASNEAAHNRFHGALALLDSVQRDCGADESISAARESVLAAQDAWDREQAYARREKAHHEAAIRVAVERADRMIAEEDPSAAISALENALSEYGAAAELDSALERAREAEHSLNVRRERRAALREAAQRCTDLIAAGDLGEAGRILQNAMRDFPDEPELVAAQQLLRAEWDRRRRSEATRRAADNARMLLDQGHPARAIALLEAAAAQYPDDPTVRDALARARQVQGEQRKAEMVESVCRETRAYLDRNDFDRALKTVEMNLEVLSGESRLIELRETVIAARRSFERAPRKRAASVAAVTDETPIAALTREAEMAATVSRPAPSKELPPAVDPGSPAWRTRSPQWRRIALAGAGSAIALGAILIGMRAMRPGAPAATALTIETEPAGATVKIGERSCVTPECRVELPAGNYPVEARLPGYAPASEVVSIHRKESARVRLVLVALPTSLAVTSNFATGNVSLDGSPAGQLKDGQLTIDKLQPGLHRLTITSPDGEVSMSFKTGAAQLPELQGEIAARDTGAVVVTSMGASVRTACFHCDGVLMVDGKPLDGKAIASGTHELAARGARGQSQRAFFRTSEAPAVAIDLSSTASPTGTLVVETNVDGASVLINRRRLDRQTEAGRLAIPLAPRDYTIEIHKQGYRATPERLVAKIRKGDQFRAAFRMDPNPGAIVLSGAAEGATVLIDGSAAGTVRGGSFSAAVPPGQHTVALAKDGFKTASAQRSFEPGETIRLNNTALRLEPLPQPPKQPPQQPLEPSAEEIEANEWTIARSARDRASIQAFLQKHPDTTHRHEAQQLLAQLEWDAVDRKDRSALERFTVQHRGTTFAQQAAAEIARIDRETAAAAAAKTVEEQSTTDRDEIAKVLTGYAAAFQKKDLNSLKTVWPNLPEAALAQVFRGKGEIRSELRPLAPAEFNGDRATVRCMRTTQQVTQFGRQKPVEETRTVRLRRESGRWVIYAID